MKIWKFLLFVIGFFLITYSAWADTFTTVTGQGYYTWNGQVISYYKLTPNSTLNLVNGVTATDTNGTPTVQINLQAFNSYVCSLNPNQPQCQKK